MNWRHIKLVFRREMRDQLRDRRTLFLIAVLPILFYPLLGISFFQIAQFLRQHPSKILIVGHEETRSDLPALIDKGQLASQLYDSDKPNVLELEFLPLQRLEFIRQGKWSSSGSISNAANMELNDELTRLMKLHACDAVIFFPPNFFQQLENYFDKLPQHARAGTGQPPAPPQPQVVFDNSSEKKGLAHVRVSRALEDWSAAVGQRSLQMANLPGNASAPIGFTQHNVAEAEERINTTLWSKILPFVLLIWAVTGAFYPAVDLCAGEKERGTLETLLSSPARRGEIVMGKLLTVMTFSIVTAVLNLVSISITGAIVMNRLNDIAAISDVGPPPFTAMIWLFLILIPVAAMFSAICLALAAFARSTKEGQYYLMPVVMITMPLILLPMKPDAELNLGFSLIPVSGIVLLMRSIMEGTINELWPYAFPVAAVTFGCCWLAVRWAIDQFNSEEVLFREGERWDVSTWLQHLIHDRQPSPTVALALLCGVLVLIVKFFMPAFIEAPQSLSALEQITFAELAKITLITQLS
ncbi:MAG: ABC transporter permease subunit, partial [Planctomycetota bacterium]|nr:ABC transporter permease subunit [Planctomycetota bacterium]